MNTQGFTLIELLVASALTLGMLGVALGLIGPARDAEQRDSAGVDLAQRLRVSAEMMVQDIRGAGAGALVDAHASLVDSVPVVQPLASLHEDRPTDGGFHALRVMSVPSAAGQAVLRDVGPQHGVLPLSPPPSCPGSTTVCGFSPGDVAIIFDAAGMFDTFLIAAVSPAAFTITPGGPLTNGYSAGAVVAAIEIVNYGLSPDGQGGQRLVKVTGGGATLPVVDHVVALEFSMYGASTPPIPGRDLQDPPSYGPIPPVPGVDDPRDAWGAGESCTTRIDSAGTRQPRLPSLGSPGQTVPLPPSALTDGPWCPDRGDDQDYDADLLRVRRLDLRIRVEVASAQLRGPAGPLYRRPGHGSRSGAWVPDGEIRVTVAPRNLAR